MPCSKTYDAVTDPSQRAGTHTCELPSNHEGPHRCPLCGTVWTAPHRRRPAPITAAMRNRPA